MGSRIRLVGLAALFALVTACGGGGGEENDGVASIDEPGTEQGAGEEKLSDEDQMLRYVECLQDNGVDIEAPPPGAGAGGGGVVAPALPVGEAGNEAFDKCQGELPNGGEPPPLSAEDLDELRKQAKCMRDHGFDMPDPTAENPILQFDDAGDPEAMQKAMEECGFGDSVSIGVAPEEGK